MSNREKEREREKFKPSNEAGATLRRESSLVVAVSYMYPESPPGQSAACLQLKIRSYWIHCRK